MSKPWIREWPGGWFQVKVPLPYSLKWVNAYLLPEAGGWTLLDPGLRTPEAEALWVETLETLGIRWQEIKQIVLTHHHPDHYGLAGWFQERTGAAVWMSAGARSAAERMWGDGETFTGRMLEAFRTHGLPDELAEAMREHLLSFRERVSPQPLSVSVLEAGSRFRMAGIAWELIGGEGHAPGHLLFYDRQGRRMICGDQVLPDISPNISWLPDGDSSPLASYLDSLHAIKDLHVAQAFPGHRDPFERFSGRISELLAHHERRLDKLCALVGTDGITSFEACERLFGTHLRGHAHHLRFALAETIAHLILLAERGKLTPIDEGDNRIVRWSAAGEV